MDFPSALHYPLATINPPSGHLSLNPCRVILHPVTVRMENYYEVLLILMFQEAYIWLISSEHEETVLHL